MCECVNTLSVDKLISLYGSQHINISTYQHINKTQTIKQSDNQAINENNLCSKRKQKCRHCKFLCTLTIRVARSGRLGYDAFPNSWKGMEILLERHVPAETHRAAGAPRHRPCPLFCMRGRSGTRHLRHKHESGRIHTGKFPKKNFQTALGKVLY